jgi:hypothetical protein
MAFDAGMNGDAGREKNCLFSGVFMSGGGAAATLTRVNRGGLISCDRSNATRDGGCPGDACRSTRYGCLCHPRN